MKVAKRFRWEGAHRLPWHAGLCRHLHGHSYALTVVFDDEQAHDVYQVHPVHDTFRDECGSFWTRVLIYDSVA